MNELAKDYQHLIITAYSAFNARDIDTVLQTLHPKVKWARAWEGAYAHGHNEVRAYWERQWKEVDPHVIPVNLIALEDGKIKVEVDQLVKDLQGKVLFKGRVFHVYTIQDDLLYVMDIMK
jgi:nuclear transport factor 2 (NTF2) superfamily protein